MKTRRPRSSNSLAERLPSAKWPLLIRPPASASWVRPTPSARIVATAAMIEDFFMPSAFQKESPAQRDILEVWYATYLASFTHSLVGRPPASRSHVPPAYCDNQVL